MQYRTLTPTPSYFVGFDRLEHLLAARLTAKHPTALLYANIQATAPPDWVGLIQTVWLVVAATHQGDCWYWRMPVAAAPLSGASPNALAEARSALEAMSTALRSRGLAVVEALMALPTNLPLVDGQTAMIEYDPVCRAYRPSASCANAAA
jgi:hypothetical protein